MAPRTTSTDGVTDSTSARKRTYGSEAAAWNWEPLNRAVETAKWLGAPVGGDQFNTQAGFLTQLYGNYGNGAGFGATSGASAAGGAGGSGSSPLTQAIRTLYGMYNRPQDNGLMNLLAGYNREAQATGDSAIARLREVIGQAQNPYAGQVAAGQVTANPLAEYMKANGVAPTQADSLQQLLVAQNAAEQQAAQGMQDRLSQSWQNSQQGRTADAAASEAAFRQMLAANNANAQQVIAQQQQQRRDELMMQILQMAVSGGADLNKMGVRF